LTHGSSQTRQPSIELSNGKRAGDSCFNLQECVAKGDKNGI